MDTDQKELVRIMLKEHLALGIAVSTNKYKFELESIFCFSALRCTVGLVF